jgi:hypothetical protein
MTGFSKAVIYRIYCKDITVLEIYIGSTHDEIHREQGHKSVCNNENAEDYNTPVYNFIRENGGWDNWIFKVIEKYPCENEEQLVKRERDYYDLLNPALNTYRPYITEEERKEEKRIYDVKYKANYREKNRDEIL